MLTWGQVVGSEGWNSVETWEEQAFSCVAHAGNDESVCAERQPGVCSGTPWCVGCRAGCRAAARPHICGQEDDNL